MKTNSYKIAFGFLIFFTIAFAVFSFDGFYFYDDYAYIYYAQQIVSGEYQIANTDIFAHRWGIILPLALSLKIFGLSEWVVCALPVLASLCSLGLLYLFSKNLSTESRLYAILFFGLDFYTLFFTNKIYPDVLLTTLVLASLYCLWHRNKHWVVSLGFVCFNFWAFLCKELIIYLLPFYVLIFAKDLRQKQNYHFWIVSAFIVVLLTTIYLIVYQNFTGNLFFRFQLIQDAHQDFGQFSYFHKGRNALLQRITYEPILMFINTTTLITFSGAIVWLLFGNFNPKSKYYISNTQKEFVSYLASAFASGLLMFWLMTTNFTIYEPIHLYPRHILFLLPLGAMLSAVALESKKISTTTAVLLLFSALWAWKSIGYKTSILYLLLAVWLILKYFVNIKIGKTIWEVSFAVILLLHPLYTMLKPTETGYWAEKEIFEKYVVKLQEPCIIYTDDKLLTGHRWYFKFKQNNSLVFKDFAELDKDKALHLKKYVLINQYSIAYFKQIGVQFPYFVEKQPDSWQKVAEKDNIKLYLFE